MKYLSVFIGFFIVFTLEAKELFNTEHIPPYLSENNPHVYAAIGQKYIDKEKENASHGGFDTQVTVKYDNKDYPATTGEFVDIALEKPIENGMEFLAGYRDARGTQEYNNIKTGDDGEARIGIKVPVFSVFNDINERKFILDSARLQSQNSNLNTMNNLSLLYLQVSRTYYKLLHDKALLRLTQELLSAAKERMGFIKKRVEVGSFAKITLLEAQQQIINREQRVLATNNTYTNTFENLLNYLNISKEYFIRNYDLPSLPDVKETNIDLALAIDNAFENRAELKVLENEKDKMYLQTQYTSLLKYPKLNLSLQGVHDFEKEEEGVKFTLDMAFPLERRKYLGKSAQIKKSLSYIEKNQEKKKLTITTNIKRILNSLQAIEQNINNSIKEIDLVEQLQQAENKKYALGRSDLFRLNQREVYTMSVKKKLLNYRLNYAWLQEELNREMGKIPEFIK